MIVRITIQKNFRNFGKYLLLPQLHTHTHTLPPVWHNICMAPKLKGFSAKLLQTGKRNNAEERWKEWRHKKYEKAGGEDKIKNSGLHIVFVTMPTQPNLIPKCGWVWYVKHFAYHPPTSPTLVFMKIYWLIIMWSASKSRNPTLQQ